MSDTFRLSIVILFLVVMTGCASMQLGNLFQSYSESMQAVRQSITSNNLTTAQAKLPTLSKSNTNYTLNLLEQGRVSFLQGNYQHSLDFFNKAYLASEEERAGAKLSVGSGVERLNALVTNDSAIRYQLAPYELSMLHTYQALNYLYTKDIESALVEVRRANLVQERALANHEQTLVEESINSSNINWQQVNAALSPLDSRIGDIKNGFQNAYTFYLSGLLYEASGELNDAYIDYKKALEIYSDNLFIQQDVLRLGSALGMDNDLKVLQERYGKYQQKVQANAGQLVVIVEQSLIDSKVEAPLRLPIFTRNNDMRFYSLAIPTYRGQTAKREPLTISVEGNMVSSQLLVKLQALVTKQLKDDMPAIVSRQVLRLITKEQLRRKMSREGGDVGNVLAGLYSLASERADTRSWLTLPGDVQLLKMSLAPGTHELKLGGIDNVSLPNIKVNPNRITLLTVTKMGNYTQYKVTNL